MLAQHASDLAELADELLRMLEPLQMRDALVDLDAVLEAGRRLGDRQHLLQAESILKEIGAVVDLAAARESLANLRGK